MQQRKEGKKVKMEESSRFYQYLNEEIRGGDFVRLLMHKLSQY